MAGDMKEFLQNVEWGTINNESEYKKYEKLIKNPQGKEEFKQEVDAKWSQILQSFWDWLDQKIQQARSEKWKMNPDVREAYNVLGKLKDKQAWAPAEQAINGRAWLYNEMKNAAEQEAALDKKYQEILTMIDKNPDWSYVSKQTAKQMIKELFAECKTVEEFQRRTGSTLDGIQSFDDVKDVIKWSISVLKEIPWLPKKAVMEVYRLCWVGVEKLNQMWKEMLEKGYAAMSDFVEWAKEAWQKISDMAKTVIEFWGDMFKQFLNYLEEVKEWVEEALNAAWEACWKQWDKFVNMCWGLRDSVVAFWRNLVEEWKLAWRVFLDSMVNNWEKAKAVCIELINKWIIKMGELVDWCKGMAKKWKEMLIGVIESSISMWNQFADYCKENWEAAKWMFKEVSRALLEKWKMTLQAFVDRCKWAWETVKDAACSVLLGLVAAWKFTLDLVCDVLLVAVGTVVVLWELLIKAWKEIYKKWKEFANFMSNLFVSLWEKSKDLYKSAAEFVKAMIDKCKEFGISALDFVKAVWTKLEQLWISVKDFIHATFESVKASLKNKIDDVAKFFKELWMKIEDVVVAINEKVGEAWTTCAEFVMKNVKNFKEAVSILVEKCKKWIDAIWKAVMKCGKFVAEFINYAKTRAKITYSKIKEWCGNRIDAINAFFTAAIETCKIKWELIKEWCNGQLENIKDVLKKIYWKSKEKVKELLDLMVKGWEKALDAWKFILKLWIGLTVGAVMVVIEWLKQAGETLQNIAKMCVDTLVRTWKFAADKVCDFLASVYWTWEKWCKLIWQYVAEWIRTAAKSVREWIYKTTNNALAAYEAMEKFISDWVKDVAKWLYQKWIALKDICRTIKRSFGNSLKAAWQGLQAFAEECRIGFADLLYAAWDWVRW